MSTDHTHQRSKETRVGVANAVEDRAVDEQARSQVGWAEGILGDNPLVRAARAGLHDKGRKGRAEAWCA